MLNSFHHFDNRPDEVWQQQKEAYSEKILLFNNYQKWLTKQNRKYKG